MKRLFSIVICSAVVASPAFAGCVSPLAPTSLPDGKTAGKEVMMAKKKEVDQFRKDMEAYLTCESSAAKAEKAQAELERVASRFNAEIRAFKAANASS